MCDFSRVSAWFCDEKISLKKVVSTFTSGGTMSLVGTRPILQDELQKYELHHRARIAIKPGITGMWQVSGRSDITDFEANSQSKQLKTERYLIICQRHRPCMFYHSL